MAKRGEHPPTSDQEIACPHVTLVARWDNADDIGHDDRATSFRCEACGQEFSSDEVTRLRESEAERLRQRLAS
jgi:hypothetical protein